MTNELNNTVTTKLWKGISIYIAILVTVLLPLTIYNQAQNCVSGQQTAKEVNIRTHFLKEVIQNQSDVYRQRIDDEEGSPAFEADLEAAIEENNRLKESIERIEPEDCIVFGLG